MTARGPLAPASGTQAASAHANRDTARRVVPLFRPYRAQVAEELRAAAAERLGDSQVPWDFQWRQGQIAHELIAVAESVQAARPGDIVVIEVGSSSSAVHRMVGSVAVNLARHSPVPVTIVP